MKLSITAMASLLLTASFAQAQLGSGSLNDRIDAFENGLDARDDDSDQLYTLKERMEHWGVPGIAVAVLRDGALSWARGYGLLQASAEDPVNAQSVFSVGSVSKVGTAVTIMRLVDEGMVDVDTDVNEYLRQWKVPQNEFTAEKPVTLRRILSHTAGLTVHGFADFQPGEDLPDVVDILRGTGAAKNRPIFVDLLPGSEFRYSGGGTTVAQLLIEEVTGVPFTEAVHELVFEPLGMTRSTYVNPIPPSHGNIAKAHNSNGNPRALPRGYEAMPEAAASGLWTSVEDFSKLVIALMDSYHGKPDALLSQELTHEMMVPVLPSEYGMGPNIEGVGDDRRFGHGGSNNSYKAYFQGHLTEGYGYIIFTNSASGQSLIGEVRQALQRTESWTSAP